MKQTNTGHAPAERMREIRLNLIEYAAAHTLEELMTRALDDNL